MNRTINYYNEHADNFKKQYLSVNAEEIHQSWIKLLPNYGDVLDVGAGVGRDALWLSQKGYSVSAIEPANEMRLAGQELTRGQNIKWINDQLPELETFKNSQQQFDLILLSAVWMHIPGYPQREESIQNLSRLLKQNGKLIITLRHGSSPDSREMFPVEINELVKISKKFHLKPIKIVTNDNDKMCRQTITWETIVFTYQGNS